MDNSREQATQKFTEAIVGAVEDARNRNLSQSERQARFDQAAEAALETLTKKEVIDILMFVIQDHELFFDIFEQAARRKIDGPGPGSR